MRRISGFALLALGMVALVLSTRSVLADDIVDAASKHDEFSTLVDAIKKADLVDTLKAPGPFTLFAPTNAAFKKIPAKKLAALLNSKSALVAVLTYHLLPSKMPAADLLKLKNGAKVKTVEGSDIILHNKKGVKVNKAEAVKTDIECDNGVIHAIDAVLLPPDLKSKTSKRP